MQLLVLTSLILATCVAGYDPPEPEHALCGKQRCFPPNECRVEGDLSVCVRVPAPTCAATSCVVGQVCVLRDFRCDTLPCDPQPVCVDEADACTACIPPHEFCNVQEEEPSTKHPYGLSSCGFVVQATCDNLTCKPGYRCQANPVQCFRAPCPIFHECVPDY